MEESELDTNVLESKKLEFLKIAIITTAGWSLILTKLMSLESTFLLLALISIGVFRRPLKEAFHVPKRWIGVLLFVFVLLGIVPILFYMPLGESSLNLINHRMSAVVALLFIWVVFWQLKPSEDVIWWSLILTAMTIPFIVAYEMYQIGSFDAILTHRFGGFVTPTVIRFGIYSNLLNVILLGGFIWAIKRGQGAIFILLVAILLSFVGALLSNTRAAWMGLPEALIGWGIFYWLYLRQNSVVNKKKVVAFGLFFLVAFITILFYFGDRVEKRWNAMTSEIVYYFEGSGETAGSVGLRLVMFEAGIKGFMEKPLTGVGEDNSMAEQIRLTAPIMEEIYGQNKGFAFGHLHNQYIDAAFTRGVLGLLSLLITIGYLIFFFGKKVQQTKQNREFSPWPLVGLLFVISSSISMLAEAWIHLSTGVAFFIFFISLFVFLSFNTSKHPNSTKV